MPKGASRESAPVRVWWRRQSGRRKRQFLGGFAIAALLLAAAALSITWGDALWQGLLAEDPTPTAALPAATPIPLLPASEADGTTVWLPWSGSRYHANPTCGGMQGAFEATLGEAKALGLTPCGRCKPPE